MGGENKVINNMDCSAIFGRIAVITVYNGNAAIHFTSIELELIWLEESRHKRVRTVRIHTHPHKGNMNFVNIRPFEFSYSFVLNAHFMHHFTPIPFLIPLRTCSAISCLHPFTSPEFSIKVIQHHKILFLFHTHSK